MDKTARDVIWFILYARSQGPRPPRPVQMFEARGLYRVFKRREQLRRDGGGHVGSTHATEDTDE